MYMVVVPLVHSVTTHLAYTNRKCRVHRADTEDAARPPLYFRLLLRHPCHCRLEGNKCARHVDLLTTRIAQLATELTRDADAFFYADGLQVLVFRDDARLWSLDAELLADVSHYHFTFADAYLAHLLSSQSNDAMGRLDAGYDVPTNIAPLAVESLQVTVRLGTLASRSERLAELCQAALAQRSNIGRVSERLPFSA